MFSNNGHNALTSGLEGDELRVSTDSTSTINLEILHVYYERQHCSTPTMRRKVAYTPWSKKTGPPNTLSYNAIISQYSFNKFYEMFEEVKDCKQ